MNYSVVIVSSGRPAILEETIRDVLAQSTPPAQVIVSTIAESDWLHTPANVGKVAHIFGRRGIPVQLNAALDLVSSSSEVVFIFDDDVVLPSDYTQCALEWFRRDPALLAFDGTVLQDGNISRQAAEDMLRSHRSQRVSSFFDRDRIYGCNMCARHHVFSKIRFDEKLEGYAWLFEFDWIRRVRKTGKTGRVTDCELVHLMAQSGRAPGYKLGFMQVAHPIYLWRKRSIGTIELATTFIWKQLIKNAVLAVRSDGEIDRRGRLKGNLAAILAFFKGNLPTPESASATHPPS